MISIEEGSIGGFAAHVMQFLALDGEQINISGRGAPAAMGLAQARPFQAACSALGRHHDAWPVACSSVRG